MTAIVLEESQCWGGRAPALAFIDGVVLFPAPAVLIIFWILLFWSLFWGQRGHGSLRFLLIALFLRNRGCDLGFLPIPISVS